MCVCVCVCVCLCVCVCACIYSLIGCESNIIKAYTFLYKHVIVRKFTKRKS